MTALARVNAIEAYYDITSLLLEYGGSDIERLSSLPELDQRFWRSPAVVELLRQTREHLWRSRSDRGISDRLEDPGDPAEARACERALAAAVVEGVTDCLAQGGPPPPGHAVEQSLVDFGLELRATSTHRSAVSESDAWSTVSFGPSFLLRRLDRFLADPDAATHIDRLCTTYEILELEAADPLDFSRGVGTLVNAVRGGSPSTRDACARALSLITDAVSTKLEYLWRILVCLLEACDPEAVDLAETFAVTMTAAVSGIAERFVLENDAAIPEIVSTVADLVCVLFCGSHEGKLRSSNALALELERQDREARPLLIAGPMLLSKGTLLAEIC